jgi:hypothetical protein
MNAPPAMDENWIDEDFTRFAHEFHNTMKTRKLMLAYDGEVTQQLTKAFAALAEQSLDKEEEDNMVKRKVFHVMVECLQNVGKHTDNQETGDPLFPGNGIFLVGRSDDHYTITTGNTVSSDKRETISTMLDDINKLDKDGIKALYKKQLKEARLSEKGGAGLGFIDISKKTGQKLGYSFIDVSDKTCFFLLKVKVLRN